MPKLLPLDQWKAPWETRTENGQVIEIPEAEWQIDPEKLKKYIHGLLGDKERLQDGNTKLTTERDNYKTQLDAKAREGETDEQRKARERREAADSNKERDLKLLKYEVAAAKGLTMAQAQRLVGNTKEELMTDADQLKLEWGGEKEPDRTEGDTDKDSPPRRTPKATNNPGDPRPDDENTPTRAGKDLLDYVNKTFPTRY